MVAARATEEGRNDSLQPGLRYYRFSHATRYRKKQILMPGIVVVLQGAKTAHFGDRALSYDAMRYLVLCAEAVCDATTVDATPERPYLAIHLDLPPDLLARTLLNMGEPPPAPSEAPPGSYVAPIDDAVLDAMARLVQACDDPTDRKLIAPLVIEEIIVRLLRSDAGAAIRQAAGVTRSGARIQAAVQFIRDHFAGPLTVEQLAQEAAMSPSHFAHRFRDICGVSPMRYLREVRLNEARALMLAGGLRAGEAAARVGFDSAAHFTREFKRRYDAAPATYVQRMLAQHGQQSRSGGQ